MPTAMANVRKALDEVRAVMTDAGYSVAHYRLVLQSYPSPVPRGAEARYAETGWTRLSVGGCPFWNRDLDWARDSLVNQIADHLRSVAASRGAQFLDLRDLLQGREVCAAASSLVTASNPPSSTRSEWTRFLVSGAGQGDLQESFHPNAYGQRALGAASRSWPGRPARPTPAATRRAPAPGPSRWPRRPSPRPPASRAAERARRAPRLARGVPVAQGEAARGR
jgi:hypothetical protein